MIPLRPVTPEDLLGRRAAPWSDDTVRELLRNRGVLVTGAAGSIGSALCRQILQYEPSRLVGVDCAETPLHELIADLAAAYPGAPFVPELGDVTDETRMDQVATEHRAQVVFHAAALKHVPLLESHPREAVRVNVHGTRVVARAALGAGAAVLVLVSTDKAVDPASVMGTTKRLAEAIVEQANGRAGARCTAVRFGNVLGSRGSVLETFERQLARGGPLTVTHEDMTRYFMTTTEAVRLVLEAAVVGEGADVLVLEMGEPVRILDLARELLRCAGRAGTEVTITGIRPGEKLHEERHGAGETLAATSHPLIRRVRRTAPPALDRLVERLLAASAGEARVEIARWLGEAGFTAREATAIRSV